MKKYTFNLDKAPTRAPKSYDKGETKSETIPAMHERLYSLQRMLFAQSKYSILMVFQGLDAAGKNSMTKRVFYGVNPLGCQVHQFTVPTDKERSYDFLRRTHQRVPPKGMIHIFNRSHYEDILVPTVEGTFDKDLIDKRYDYINDFEELLYQENNTIILKFYLHISREEQKERLEGRIEKPRSYRKHNDGDWSNREKWDKYIDVYHEIFKRTNKSHAPWYVIPADQKRYSCYEILKILIETMEEKIDLERPDLESEMFEQKD